MYKCQKCGLFTKLGEKLEKIVTEYREKIYKKKNRKGFEVEAGRGWEIVKEIDVCQKCYKEHVETQQDDE